MHIKRLVGKFCEIHSYILSWTQSYNRLLDLVYSSWHDGKTIGVMFVSDCQKNESIRKVTTKYSQPFKHSFCNSKKRTKFWNVLWMVITESKNDYPDVDETVLRKLQGKTEFHAKELTHVNSLTEIDGWKNLNHEISIVFKKVCGESNSVYVTHKFLWTHTNDTLEMFK